MTQNFPQPTVAVAGGGLAGLAAACALADSGFRVSLFERRPYLGGRASSYEHPGTGEVVDNCQHVLFRVCTNLVEFYRRIGVEDKIRWYDEMTFIEPGGRTSVMRASPLPAPLHTGPSFLRFPFLNTKDKLAISRASAALTLTPQPDTGRSFLDWCHRHGQTETAIERFWRPILVSALSEDLDLISISYAAQVVRESMKSPAARHMGVPTIPLTDLYNRAGDYIRQLRADRFGETHVNHQAIAEECGNPSARAIEELIGDHEFERPMLFFERAHGTERYDALHAQRFHAVNVGAEIQIGRRDAVPAAVPR